MKKRILFLFIFTVLFAVFFSVFRIYTSQSSHFISTNKSITTPPKEFFYTHILSRFGENEFTGPFGITKIQNISSYDFDSNAGYRLMYHLEYPEFTGVTHIPIKNFLVKKLQDAQENLQAKKTKNGWKYPEFTAQFVGYTGTGYHSLVYSLAYHTDTLYPIRKIHTFLINPEGFYIAPGDLSLLSSGNRDSFVDVILPYLRRQIPQLFSGEFFFDGIDRYISYPNFAFSGDDVLLFFEAGSITHKKHGNIAVKIPYTQLQDFFLKDPKKVKKLQIQRAKQVPEKNAKRNAQKYVALTFDDGPNDSTTLQLLDTLEKKGVKATFFVIGQRVEKYPHVLKKIHEKGHEIENHTWSHPNLIYLKPEILKKEIESTDAIIKHLTGVMPKFIRPPYGAFNTKLQNALGRPLLMWSVDPKDWKYRNVGNNIRSTLRQVRDGSIILYHDIHSPSVRTIGPLIDELRIRGYEFMTLEELFARYQGKVPTGSLVCYSGDRCR